MSLVNIFKKLKVKIKDLKTILEEGRNYFFSMFFRKIDRELSIYKLILCLHLFCIPLLRTYFLISRFRITDIITSSFMVFTAPVTSWWKKNEVISLLKFWNFASVTVTQSIRLLFFTTFSSSYIEKKLLFKLYSFFDSLTARISISAKPFFFIYPLNFY